MRFRSVRTRSLVLRCVQWRRGGHWQRADGAVAKGAKVIPFQIAEVIAATSVEPMGREGDESLPPSLLRGCDGARPYAAADSLQNFRSNSRW